MKADRKYYYNNIDYFKIILCVLVICIHTTPLYNINSWASDMLSHCISRVAVPLFFGFSGFFLRKQFMNRLCTVRNVYPIIKKYLMTYIGWSVIYIPVMIVGYYRLGNTFGKAIFLEIKDTIFYGSYFHLWYFPAVIFCSAFMTILWGKLNSKRSIVFLGAILYIFGTMTSTYNFLFDIEIESVWIKNIIDLYFYLFVSHRNGLFFGFIFYGIGFLIADKQKDNVYQKRHIIGLMISLMMLIGEGIYVLERCEYKPDAFIFLVPVVYFGIRVISRKADDEKKKMLGIDLRFISTFVYCVHPIFMLIWNYMPYIRKENYLCMFVFVLSGSFIAALLYEVIIKQKACYLKC